MENLKIKVNSETESKEVQELFFELGFVWFGTKKQIHAYRIGIFFTAKCDSIDIISYDADYMFDLEDHKEITLPELRDLVVLKRNDRNDRTHTDQDNWSWFISSNGTGYVFGAGNANGLHQWDESSLDMVDLKPIEKPMKEYLRKNSNGTYSYIGTVRPEHVSDFMIEIPDGADFVTEHTTGTIHFWRKGSYKTNGNNHDWIDMTCHNEKYDAAYWCEISPSNIIWQRHTHPEALPFIDDEPSLNDQYAEIEKVRQSHRTASETSNPTIKETLSQRQEQYGSFEDVAMITEQMVDVMRKGYYENLAYNQKMALYMICSKMARIVNGNPNHKDSWHDIAGYATLIDNELVSEKDMPF